MDRRTVADWLASLQREGVATIDADVMLDAERLLAMWAADGKVRPEVAADALAARVATGAEQYRTVRTSFLETFGECTYVEEETEAAREETEGVENRGESGWKNWVVGIATLGMLCVVWWATRPEPPGQATVATSTVEIPIPESEADSNVVDASTSGADDTNTSDPADTSTSRPDDTNTSDPDDTSTSSLNDTNNSRQGDANTSSLNDRNPANPDNTNTLSPDDTSSPNDKKALSPDDVNNSGLNDASTSDLDDARNTDSDDTSTSATTDNEAAVLMVQAEHEAPVYRPGWPWRSWRTLSASLAAALLVMLGLRLLLAKTSRDETIAKGAAERRQAIQQDGVGPGEIYRFAAPPPLAITTIDAAADLLGRPSHGDEGSRLDVIRTLDRTVKAGGLPRPRFLRASRQPPLVVLVDVEEWGFEGQAFPLAHTADWILERWRRTGLRFERFDYEGTLPTEVRRPDSGRVISLSALARRHGEARLLVWSRLRRLRGDSLAVWLTALRPWKRRAWIDLDPRPAVMKDVGNEEGRVAAALERLEEVEVSGLARYPLTCQGLVAAARHVVAERSRPPPVSDEAVRRRGDAEQEQRIEKALKQWSAAACCVPDPTWSHLDMLRTLLPDVQRVIPESRGVWWLLRWLEDHECLVGTASNARNKLALRPGAERQLLGQPQMIVIDGRERKVQQWITQRLVQQLHDGAAASSGITNQVEREEREAKLAYYQCDEDLRGGVEGLCRLLGSSGDALARDLLRRLAHRIDVGELTEGRSAGKKASALVKTSIGPRVDVRDAVWRGLRRWELVIATSVLGITMTMMLWRPQKVVGVRVTPAGYEVVLGKETEEITAKDDATSKPVAASADPVPIGPKALPKEETVALPLPAGARPMKLRRMEAGKFWMGSAVEEEHQPDEQRHRVTLSRPFMLCETEVTQAQWKAVMGENPSIESRSRGDDVAVTNVSWVMAVQFMNKLSRKQGLAECYSEARINPVWERSCEGYRLPTEAEWEYAARAGSEMAYSFGDDAAKLGEHAWYGINADDRAHPVGTKTANPWGLYDVHGNVWEWVWDWYESDYDSRQTSDPTGARGGKRRVLRGGSFGVSSVWLRSAVRFFGYPDYVFWYYGVRCARGPHPDYAVAP